ncbi:MAG: hypothetical protein BRC52_13150 [Cyanobacteria bacterium SW_5_48_44]|nr:MAG: hypothetical protein BRC52_13150 [Cyanobacteria bacterium SW_5_48_44]
MVEKEWSLLVNKTILLKMLPQFYQGHLQKYLISSQLLNLNLLGRRHIQRFLKLPCLSVALIWFPIIKNLIEAKIKLGSRLYVS